MAVVIKKDNVDRVIKAVREMTNKSVFVGIPAEMAERDDGEINNAAIGYLNEMGRPESNLPARPHLVPGVEKAAPEAARILQQTGSKALSGQLSQVMVGLNSVGLLCQSSVRGTITEVIPPPLSPKTIAARQARGHSGETPLIDTGAYLQHISYVIRNKT